jgi:hypothetical protein
VTTGTEVTFADAADEVETSVSDSGTRGLTVAAKSKSGTAGNRQNRRARRNKEDRKRGDEPPNM